MTTNSVFYLIPAAHRAAGNKLWQLLGLGPDNYSVAFSSTGTGTPEYFGGNYENMPAHEEASVRALKHALPVLDEELAWGEDGLPTEEAAQAAAAAMGFFIREDPSMTAVEHQTAIAGALGQVLWSEEEEG